MIPTTIYVLEAEDFTGVGGPMHIPVSTPVLFTEMFSTLDDAKHHALKDYRRRTKNRRTTFEWSQEGRRRCWTSGDLLFICYTITERKVKA